VVISPIRTFVAGVALVLVPVCASAQELTPGAYWPLPGGINILSFINSFNTGDVTFDPTLPVVDAHAKINTTAVVYTRTLSIAGRSANIGVQLPVIAGHVDGLYLGAPTAVDRFGLGDPRVSVGLNLYGAPAMTPRAFGSYRMRTLVGVSVAVAPPLGQYDNTKIVNLGNNRWSFKPELGLTHGWGPWIVEVMAGVWLFTDNTDFSVGHTRGQAPIVSTQFHLTYRFTPRIWLAGDTNYYTGGQTSVDGVKHPDVQHSSRVGSTFSWGITPRHSLRASLSFGAYSTIGGDFTSVAVGYNYAW
jgi:hypothetical protein